LVAYGVVVAVLVAGIAVGTESRTGVAGGPAASSLAWSDTGDRSPPPA
jgi:hypothetical protein